ncbi:sensor histidine kinase [Halobacillus sp. Marseille-P3879]|uniref:ATP-binding protein n=1 Tax=Halobacillus sp. Marseille-P3879 TaxID=2045014 RepID=UPI000C79D675|nr:sensor histidine kinase [Halobacillus sp. Marseille-P3879]
MIKKLLNVSIQTKILGLVTGLIIFVIVLLLGVFTYFDTQQIFSNKKDLSLQTATTLSFMPTVSQALEGEEPYSELKTLSERIRMQSGANFVVVQDKFGKVITHPDQERVGEVQIFDDGYKARVFGGYYYLTSEEFIGKSIVGKAPVYSGSGSVSGVVTVGYQVKNIKLEIMERMRDILTFSIFVVIVGILASIFLARHIRKDTMGLEPREIATLYWDRETIFSSMNEGVIATDENGKVTMLNEAAKDLLHLSDQSLNGYLVDIMPTVHLDKIISKEKQSISYESYLNFRVIILTIVPILRGDRVLGTIITLRDKTEITEMVNALSEVKKYSEDLRAQTHEFANKMHMISGLLQLKEYEEAFQLVQEEVATIDNYNRMIFERIQDTKVQAILLGKISKASEKKINFDLEKDSFLSELPSHIEVPHLTMIIGNLIDNAFDEVLNQSERNVTFFALDIGKDVMFEVSDNGSGIPETKISNVFKPGYSTKYSDVQRGYGLYNVKNKVEELNGTIEVHSDERGTIISIFIPKNNVGGSV